MARMGKLNDLLDMRRILHNYLDFAFGERLRLIKDALPTLWPNRPGRRAKKTKSQSSTTVSGSELRFDLPITPSSTVGESMNRDTVPPKRIKRKLTDAT